MKVFYGIEEGFLVNGKDLADDKLMTFETPLLEEYITHIDFDDDFADEVQRVFPEVNKQNFFHSLATLSYGYGPGGTIYAKER
mgnify:CR=1 FL=1